MMKPDMSNPPRSPDRTQDTPAGALTSPVGLRGQGPRVLMIRPTALGDVCRTVPVLVTLRRAMPEARIEWLVSQAYIDAVRHHPDLDGVVAFPRERFAAAGYNLRVTAQFLKWCRGLRASRYDLVFDLQGLARSGLFTWVTAAPRRVGFADAGEWAWLGYNRRHRVDRHLNAVERMLALVQAEGYTPRRNTQLYVGCHDEQWWDQWLSQHGGTGPYVCLAPTARWLCKCWPIENYTRLARRLLDSGRAGQRLVILAAPQERDQLRPLLDGLGGDPRVLVPTTSVGQMMAVLSRTNLLVCNDSAALHAAVGFGRPIVAIFGPTDPARVGPYRRDDCVVRAGGATVQHVGDYRRHRDDQTLIARVSVEAVWERILQQVASHDVTTVAR